MVKLLFCVFLLICFMTPALAAEEKIAKGQHYSINFPSIVALKPQYIDDIVEAFQHQGHGLLDKLFDDKKVEKLPVGDHLLVVEVYERKLGLDFVKCTHSRKGKVLGTVWIFNHYLSHFCDRTDE